MTESIVFSIGCLFFLPIEDFIFDRTIDDLVLKLRIEVEHDSTAKTSEEASSDIGEDIVHRIVESVMITFEGAIEVCDFLHRKSKIAIFIKQLIIFRRNVFLHIRPGKSVVGEFIDFPSGFECDSEEEAENKGQGNLMCPFVRLCQDVFGDDIAPQERVQRSQRSGRTCPCLGIDNRTCKPLPRRPPRRDPRQ